MKRFDLTVSQRLSVAATAIAILIAIVVAAVALAAARVASLQNEQNTLVAPRLEAMHQFEASIFRQSVAFRNYIVSRNPDDLETFTRQRLEVAHRLDRLEALPNSAAATALLAKIRPAVTDHQKSFDHFLSIMQRGADPFALRHEELATSRHRIKVLAALEAYGAYLQRRSRTLSSEIEEATSRLLWIVLLIAPIVIAASYLGIYFTSRSVRAGAVRLVSAATAMGEGSFGPALALREPGRIEPFRDELRETAHVFGGVAAALEAREKRLAAHASLSAALGSTLDADEIAAHALRELTAFTGAEIGAVYQADAEGTTLSPIAEAALHAMLAPLAFGEGIPGLAARDRRTVTLHDIPADSPFRLRLGFDELPPRAVAAAPMIVNERVVGVIVLASLREIGTDALMFLDQAAGQLAVTLDNATAHRTIALLAADLQESNEKLQLQNEELQAQGEELQAQAEELQAQQEELQTQNEELHNQADELRAQQHSLAKANDELTEAEQQKNRFLAVLGHELRNPLAAISGAVALLGEEKSDVSQRKEMQGVIGRQTSHLTRLVDDLLDVSRITNGKISLTRSPLDLGAAVERCVSNVRRDLGPAHPRLNATIEPGIWIDGDGTRVEQIVTNLLNNALKFTPSGGAIALSLVRDGANGVITVTDNGSGIDAALLPRIWEFFVQGDGSQNGQQKGLGLGLPLVKGLVELHGGTVSAHSEGRGRGATLTVRFPCLEAPPATVAEQELAPPLQIRKSIVLVEDNDDVRRMLGLRLSRAGHSVVEVADGPSAVQAVQRVVPQVAIVDIDLPGFDGFEVARRVRLDPKLAATRLIALSGYGRPEDRQRAFEAGFDQHLVKPVDFEALLHVFEG
jgi:signal transduction histidine kinase/CHASE3 domain sensor protein